MPLTLARAAGAIGFALLAFTPWMAGAQTPGVEAPVDVTFTIAHYVVVGDNPLGEAQVQQILAPYVGVQHGMEGLEMATHALEEALRKGGFALYRVVLPPQESVDTIRIQIVKFGIVEVAVSGQKFFDEANVRASVPALQVGGTPDMRDVARQLAIANENPAKKTDVKLEESEDGKGIRANLVTTDSQPISATLGYNNTGTAATAGRGRVLAYLQDANLFDRDQVGGLAYTTSPNHPSDVKQYGLFYRAPIYALGGVLSGSYSYSSVNSGSLGNGTTITGAGTTSGLSYTQYLYADGNYKSSVALGLDDKLFRAPVIGGTKAPAGDVRSRPVSVTYVGNYALDSTNLAFNVEYDRNLGSGANNTDAAYAANRVGATSSWDVYRVGYTVNASLGGGWLLSAIMHGQYAPAALINGEQFGLGGASSLRGANERAVTGDSGLSNTFELYTPEVMSNTRLLAFYDSGLVSRYDVQPGEVRKDSLQSLGVGLRWTFGDSAQAAVDYGYVVHGTFSNIVPTGSSRVSANLLYKF